ncbi:MAG: YceI family protein [Gammaproteobacteria bacterium]|nr:YceI family protein [Gammaproteobacteria bacterium]
MKSILVTCLMLFASFSLSAQNWSLNSAESKLIFSSVKNSAVAENHSFKNFSGKVTNNKNVFISIDLSSVETNIDIRNQRMKEHLFKVDKFSTATIELSLPDGFVEELSIGKSVDIEQAFTLNLHGKSNQNKAAFRVTKLNKKQIQVVNTLPIFIQAEPFELVGGILKLQQLAKLNSIDAVIPVNLVFVFDSAK